MNQRSKEGYLLIDNRAAGGSLIEQATFTCSHCQRVLPLDPLRQRPRGYCKKCDRYLCDGAKCNSGCRPMDKVLDRVQEAASRGIIPF